MSDFEIKVTPKNEQEKPQDGGWGSALPILLIIIVLLFAAVSGGHG